jgi:hypothetical protein
VSKFDCTPTEKYTRITNIAAMPTKLNANLRREVRVVQSALGSYEIARARIAGGFNIWRCTMISDVMPGHLPSSEEHIGWIGAACDGLRALQTSHGTDPNGLDERRVFAISCSVE